MRDVPPGLVFWRREFAPIELHLQCGVLRIGWGPVRSLPGGDLQAREWVSSLFFLPSRQVFNGDRSDLRVYVHHVPPALNLSCAG